MAAKSRKRALPDLTVGLSESSLQAASTLSSPSHGSIELHYTEGWPECREAGCVKCDDEDHGPNCGKGVMPAMASLTRIYIFRGAGWPGSLKGWLG